MNSSLALTLKEVDAYKDKKRITIYIYANFRRITSFEGSNTKHLWRKAVTEVKNHARNQLSKELKTGKLASRYPNHWYRLGHKNVFEISINDMTFRAIDIYR